MIGAFRIVGYVIASADGLIADASGHSRRRSSSTPTRGSSSMGSSMSTRSSMAATRTRAIRIRDRRPRLILTRGVPALAPEPADPKAPGSGIRPARRSRRRCAALGVRSGTVAIIGGPLVYTLFLKRGYDNFHLSRAVKVCMPDGLPVFIREAYGGEPEAALAAAGLKPGPTLWLDDEVSVTDWERAG